MPADRLAAPRPGNARYRLTPGAWGVTERLVQARCAEGRIADARKIGGSWAIPSDAERPDDLRRNAAPRTRVAPAASRDAAGDLPAWSRCSNTSGPYPSGPDVLSSLMPLMNTPFEPGTCKEVLEGFKDPEVRTVAQAEYCYFCGDPEGACRAIGNLISDSEQDLAILLSACLLYAYANLPLGNINRSKFALAELSDVFAASSSTPSPQVKAAMTFVGYVSSVLLHIPLPEDAPSINELLPQPPGDPQVRPLCPGAPALSSGRLCAEPGGGRDDVAVHRRDLPHPR